jgi:hypothetical protein
VHSLVGKINIAEQADQCCQDSSRIHPIKGVEYSRICACICSGEHSDMTTTVANQLPRINLAPRINAQCSVVTLKPGQQNVSSAD